MGRKSRDQFLEEVDEALRLIDGRLKKVFLKTEVLLKEHFKERPASRESDAPLSKGNRGRSEL